MGLLLSSFFTPNLNPGKHVCTHLLSVQGQQRWEEAIAACQEGMALPSATRDFHPLRDAIAVQAALAGCFAGFQGRWLDVSHPTTHPSHALHAPVEAGIGSVKKTFNPPCEHRL